MFIYRTPYPINKGELKALMKLHEHTLTSGHQMSLMNSFTIIHNYSVSPLIFLSFSHTHKE